jgi:hypothetical protein
VPSGIKSLIFLRVAYALIFFEARDPMHQITMYPGLVTAPPAHPGNGSRAISSAQMGKAKRPN